MTTNETIIQNPLDPNAHEKPISVAIEIKGLCKTFGSKTVLNI